MEQITGGVEMPAHSWLSRNLNILDQLPPRKGGLSNRHKDLPKAERVERAEWV